MPGLSSSILFNFLGTSALTGGTSYDFSYTLTNTSSAPIDNSRASIFGFNVDPNVTGATAGGLFPDAVFKDGPFNTPNNGPNVELCFKDVNGKANNCTGGGSGGVSKGDTGGGTFSLLFETPPAVPTATLSNFYIRYQDLDSVKLKLKGDSASGIGTAIPEPATWVMMIGGFFLVGGAMRRRRNAPRFATA